MYKISKMPLAVDIGYVGETGFRKLEIDMKDWMRLMPEGVPSIVCIRPGETKADAYVAVTTFEDDVLTWVITAADIGTQEGEGEIQIWLEEEENSSVIKRGKSVKVKTRVNDAVNDPSPDTPTSQEAFIEQVTSLKTAAVNAKTAAETAQGKAEDAQDAAEAAQAAAEAVNLHPAYIDETTGHWMTWDTEEGDYVDSEVDAQGPQGDPGTDATPDLITKDYSALTFPVAKDTLCYHSGLLYKANQDISTSEEWTEAHWTATTIEAEQTLLKTAIQGVSEDVQELSDDVSVLTQETDFIHNLLGKAGQFSPSTSWYRMWGCSTYSASDGIASFLCSNQYGGIKTSVDIVVPANHKIYAFAKLKGMGARLTFASSKYANSTSADEFNFVSFIESWSEQLTRNLQIVDVSSSNFQTLYAKECGVIDLTATFGDVVPTKAQLDAFVTQVGFFENFPVGTFLRKFYTDYIKAGANGYPNLGDKTIVIMGDSITMQNTIDGNGNLTKANTNWPDYAMPLLGDPTVYNLAQDGSPYHDFNGSGTYQTFTKQYNLMVSKGWNPDIIILAFGTNDYQYTHTDDYATAMNIYSLSGLDKTNNYQCIRWAYWTLTQNYPNALIIVGTPVARADIGLFNWVREAIIQMGQTYELNIVDCMTECGIIRQYENGPGGAEGRYLADGLHPNTKGKKLLGRYWAYKIAQLFSPDKFDKSDVS